MDLPAARRRVHSFRDRCVQFSIWGAARDSKKLPCGSPVAQFAFLRQNSGIYLARYKPSLRVLNDDGEVVQQVEAESRLTAESLEATVDTDRMVYDMVQVRLPTGRYRGELTLSDLQADRAGLAVFSLDVPAYDPGKLGMSDLYLSSGFNPQGAGESLEMFRKNGRLILPNPARQYQRGAPIYLYFEVYYLGYQSHPGRDADRRPIRTSPLARPAVISRLSG